MLATFSRAALNLGLVIGLCAVFLYSAPFSGRAEMIRPGEAHLEDLAPPSMTLQAPRPGEDAEDRAKGWSAPYIDVLSAPTPRPRAQALAAAQLKGPLRNPPSHAIAALATGPVDELTEDLRFWRAARAQDPASWEAARDFLARRPHWPTVGRLRAAAERLMPGDLPAAERLAYFADREPVTARGARLLGEALIALGRQEEGEKRIAAGWTRFTGSRAEEKIYLKKHGPLLKQHHGARYEVLIWRKRLTAARRMTKKLPKGWDKLTDALVALYRSGRGVDRKIKRVPAALRSHPILNHARMVWRDRKRRRKEAESALREADAQGALGAASAWARFRKRFARDAYEDGRHQDAARISAAHGLEAGVDFADLEWFAGWMRLGRLDDPKTALAHFTRLWNGVKTPISRSRAAYWAGEAAEAAGEPALAQEWRRRAAALSSAFYGQMAAEALAERPDLSDAPQTAEPFEIAAFDPDARAAVAAADLLYAAGLQAEGRRFIKALAKRRSDAASLGWLARHARSQGDLAAEIEVAKRAFAVDAPLWSSFFPMPEEPRFAGRRVEPALLLAIARQESRFMRLARSSAGAIGLMQMMPATARASARKLGVPYDRGRLADDWGYNLSLSDAHMHGVLERYDGSYILSIAAYNAGEGNVDKWIKRFGDPRDPKADPITWIESIPFGETRNYVQRVLEAVQIYRIRLGAAPDLALAADLKR